MRERICSMICSTLTESERTLKSAMAERSAKAFALRRAPLDLGRGSEALDGLGFGIEGLEHRQQLRDREQVRDALGQIEELEASALPAHGRISADHFSKARAVHVRHIGEVQQEFAATLVEQAVHLVFQKLVALSQGDLPLEIEHYHVANRAFLDVHGHSRSRPLSRVA